MSVQSSASSELQPEANSSDIAYVRIVMAEHYPNPKEKIPCPYCGNRVQRDGMRCQDCSMHGEKKETHTCVPILLQRNAEDVLYLQRVEKAYQGHVPNLSGGWGRGPFLRGEVCCGV